MKIYTSYFAKEAQLRECGIKPIAISLYPPRWFNGVSYKLLAPNKAIFKIADPEQYNTEFNRLLSCLDPKQVLADLSRYTQDGSPIALLCFEKPSDHCHRHLVAAWLNKYNPELNIQEYEFTRKTNLRKGSI